MPWNERGWKETEVEEGDGDAFGWMLGQRPRRAPLAVGKSTPVRRPHYSDPLYQGGQEHTLFGSTAKGLEYVYSDRLWQWDYAKSEEASRAAKESGAPVGSAEFYERYLSHYFGQQVLLRHVIGGVNVSNGYEYFIFGYQKEGEDGQTAPCPGS